MTILEVNNLKLTLGNNKILKDVRLTVADGDRIGLVGPNGAGKTTLARIIRGELEPDSGQLYWHRDNIRVGYLEQEVHFGYDSFAGLWQEEADGRKLGRFMAEASRLGLAEIKNWPPEKFATLSGGEEMKLALARLKAEEPGLLILDEPTNHLDFWGIDWLIQEMKELNAAVMIISHDRYFLDQVVERIIELEQGRSREFAGNYSQYREKKQRLREARRRQYQERLKEQQKLEEEIKKLNCWAEEGHRKSTSRDMENKKGGKEYFRKKSAKLDSQAKSRVKRLRRKQEELERPLEEPEINFSLIEPGRVGRRIIEARDLSLSFAGREIFPASSFVIQRGQKVGVIGANGSGKTSLFCMLLGVLEPTSGWVKVSRGAKIGYLSQLARDFQGEQGVKPDERDKRHKEYREYDWEYGVDERGKGNRGEIYNRAEDKGGGKRGKRGKKSDSSNKNGSGNRGIRTDNREERDGSNNGEDRDSTVQRKGENKTEGKGRANRRGRGNWRKLEDKLPLEVMTSTSSFYTQEARTLLACMGITAEKLERPLNNLSTGEKVRIKFADMILNQVELMLLDEPTNHLDLHNREELEAGLKGYSGTLLIVTHDRHLLEKICDRYLVFTGEGIEVFPGRLDEALRRAGFKDAAELKGEEDETGEGSEGSEEGEEDETGVEGKEDVGGKESVEGEKVKEGEETGFNRAELDSREKSQAGQDSGRLKETRSKREVEIGGNFKKAQASGSSNFLPDKKSQARNNYDCGKNSSSSNKKRENARHEEESEKERSVAESRNSVEGQTSAENRSAVENRNFAESRTACESRTFAVRSRAEEMARENKKSRILSQISSLKARQKNREHEEEIAKLEKEYSSLIEGK